MKRNPLLLTIFAAALAMGHSVPRASMASSLSDTSISCLDVMSRDIDIGGINSTVFTDTDVVNPSGGGYSLQAEAFGSISSGQLPVEQHASALLLTDGVIIAPSDFCSLSSGNIIRSVIFGRHEQDPGASGMVDAMLTVDFSVILGFESQAGGAWQAFSGVGVTMIEDFFPIDLDDFRVEVGTEAPPTAPEGFEFTDLFNATCFRVVGTREIPIVFKYGPSARNILEVVFFGGGSVSGSNLQSISEPAGASLALTPVAVLAVLRRRRH